MSMQTDVMDRRVFAAVAQQPFESHSADGTIVHTFCTLAPVLFEDGTVAGGADQFPNNGLIWWKLRATSRQLAEPGRLLLTSLELAPQYASADPTKQYFQAVSHEIEPARPDTAIEIVNVADRAAKKPRDLVNIPGLAEMDHPPSERVLVRWHGSLYGPLDSRIAASAGGRYRVSFSAPAGESTMLRFPEEAIPEKSTICIPEIRVSLSDQPLYRSDLVVSCAYELLTGEKLASLRRIAEEVPAYRDDELIGRAARRLLTRRARQQLSSLLDSLADTLEESPEDIEAAELIEATRRRAQLGDARLGELAQALLESGVMDERLEDAIETRVRQHVERNAATLAAEIDERLAEERAELERLNRRREDLASSLEATAREARREVDEKIDASWREHRHALEQEREHLEAERRQLDERARVLTERLAAAGKRFAEGRDSLVDDFLTLLPLLQQVVPELSRATEPGARAPGAEADAAVEAASPAVEQFELPAFVRPRATRDEKPPDESEFFDRFVSHVQRAGFDYRRLDLQAFHLAVKCGDLTVVTGGPGTGKSSLPRLYAEAMAGREMDALDERTGGRYLHIAVRPGWLDLTDLLGQANVLEHTFEPSVTGLFETLVCAGEEFERNGGDSGLYVVCFDEPGPGVEQLLGGLLQTMQRPDPLRILHCFDRHTVRSTDPFHRWHTLLLPRSLRLVTAVASDDTGALPGPTLLDRSAIVMLRPGRSRELVDSPKDRGPGGVPVRLRTYDRWVRDSALPAQQAALLDRLEAPFASFGAQLTPRRYRRLCRVVASANDICGPDVAFDLQLAQRVLARNRTLFGPRVDDGLSQAFEILEPEADRFPETLNALESMEDENGDG